MSKYVDGIEHPTEKQFEKSEREIREYTVLVSGDNWDSADAYDALQVVLRSANTMRNYYRQLLINERSKRRGDDVETSHTSESKCTS